MWSRVAELMFGCWLAVSPFIFRHAPDDRLLWINDLAAAAAVIVCSLCSYARPLRYAHLGTIAVGLWLIGFGYVSSAPPAAPAYQNHILVGLMLLMLAIIPNHASVPPDSWRSYLERPAS
jgi:hypothetical protein